MEKFFFGFYRFDVPSRFSEPRGYVLEFKSIDEARNYESEYNEAMERVGIPWRTTLLDSFTLIYH